MTSLYLCWRMCLGHWTRHKLKSRRSCHKSTPPSLSGKNPWSANLLCNQWQKYPQLSHHVCILLQMERVCDPMLCGPPGCRVQRPGFGPGPSGSETKRRPYEALLHSELWRHLPHDVSTGFECWFHAQGPGSSLTSDLDVFAGVQVSASSSPGCSWL